MIQRVKQVVAAFTATIAYGDRQFVSSHLSEMEETLFWGMNLPDQRHALNVAYTAIDLAGEAPHINKELLIRCALLHDVGKKKGDVSTGDKIAAVLCHAVAPRWMKSWARLGRGNSIANLRHAFYIYLNHASRSAEMLETLGLTAEAAIVACHHESGSPGEAPELTLLRKADDLN